MSSAMSMRKNCALVAADDADNTSAAVRVFDVSSGSEDLEEQALHSLMSGSRGRHCTADTSEEEIVETGNRAAVAVLSNSGCPKQARCAAKRARDTMRARMIRKAQPVPRRPTKNTSAIDTHVVDASHDHSRPRRPQLWRFFVTWKRIEHKGKNVRLHGASTLRSTDLLAEFQTFTGQMQYYWVHMYELWRLFERQQIATRSPLKSKDLARERTRDMMLTFYYLSLPQQHVLVDDWIAERTARQRSRHAAELETCLARKTLAKIKSDMLVVVANIDYVLRENLAPHKWQGAFEGI